jgi:pimeloyl-ACP methyl ester carboxylesterase
LVLPGFSRTDAWRELPAFCRVAATITPSSDSHINIEVWLPSEEWSGDYRAVGNGGWAGSINYEGMSDALRSGYATSSTDTGHTGNGGDASFAMGHPEKLIDFAYRSVHEMALKTKAIIEVFYGTPARYAYWYGCSTGGRQGLEEAQRFPGDFDGIVADAPAINQTRLNVSYLWVAQATLKDAASYIPASKYPMIHNAVLQACDARDGQTDGVLDDPRRCRFDPEVLRCGGRDASTCLTAPQVEAARKIYAGPKNPRTLQPIGPGLEPGSELLWAPLAGGPTAQPIGDTYFKFVVFKDPTWDFRALDFDRDVVRADRLDNGLLAATEPDLTAYAARGGKLMLIHGWSDQFIGPCNTISYYQSVVEKMGAARTADFVRLFMVPGMGHCGGGEGPNTFDPSTLVERWVERGTRPDQMIASRVAQGQVDRTRPLCPYPQVARYKGTGSRNGAANFFCVDPN